MQKWINYRTPTVFFLQAAPKAFFCTMSTNNPFTNNSKPTKKDSPQWRSLFQAFESPYLREIGQAFACQISFAYSSMVRSELNLPMRATLRIAILAHLS